VAGQLRGIHTLGEVLRVPGANGHTLAPHQGSRQ
jgi:hypothetical protein